MASCCNFILEEDELMLPKYLYKILSLRAWHATERQKSVLLPAEDATAIHDRVHQRTLMTDENYMKMWKNCSPQEVMRCL